MAGQSSQLVPVIIGPTAGGKSALALELAAHLVHFGRRAEIVGADAYQVYRHMDIGTAKPSRLERAVCEHHLIDIVEPTASFSVSDWLALAQDAIDGVTRRGCVPIVVGGTLLYAKMLIDGMFHGPRPDEALRATLARCDPAALRAELERIDPASASRLHPNDIRRTIRAIEVYTLTGSPVSDLQQQWDRENAQSRYLLIELDWPVDLINHRINARVKAMVGAGLVDEVCELHEAGLLGPTAREAIGYKQLLEHFAGRCSLDDAIERIRIESRRFAKNQRTWLRRLRTHPHTLRIDAHEMDARSVVAHVCDLIGVK